LVPISRTFSAHLGHTPVGRFSALLRAAQAILKLLLEGIDLGLLVVQRALESFDVPALGLQLPEHLREVLTFDFAEAGLHLGTTLASLLQLAAELFVLTQEVPGRRAEIRLRRAGD